MTPRVAPKALMPRLTAAQRRLVGDYLAAWKPVAVLRRSFNPTYRAARAAGLDDDDIAQIAVMGVMKAATRFDPARGLKFSSYANWYVRGAVQSWGVRGKQRAFERGMRRGDPAGGRRRPLWEFLPGRDGEAGAAAPAGLADLSPRERAVLTLRFGLDGRGERTLAEVADRLGVCKERVRQIEKAAIDRLRAAAAGGED